MSAAIAEPRENDTVDTRRGSLRLEGATVRYGGLAALDHVDITVEPGQITGVIGPNGSGKSTAINVIAGTTPLAEGRVIFEGRDIGKLSVPQRADLGIARTFQATRLFDSMNVIENVMLGATRRYDSTLAGSVFRTSASRRLDGQFRKQALSILELFGSRLVPRLTHPVGTLSYANRRRVEIARALMLEPSLVLLDEPMAGMNPHESWQFAEQLPELLKRFECSALLVEHKMDIVSAVCPDVYVLDHGVELAHGRPQDVVRNPAVQEAFLGIEH
jgi:ABC-type branched-subunit amino acid transport system ATPase component